MQITVNDFINKYAPCQEGADFARTFRTAEGVGRPRGRQRPTRVAGLAGFATASLTARSSRATVHAAQDRRAPFERPPVNKGSPPSTARRTITGPFATAIRTLQDTKNLEVLLNEPCFT